jgi:hypothetical protein
MGLKVTYQYKPGTHLAEVKYDSMVINIETSHFEAGTKIIILSAL